MDAYFKLGKYKAEIFNKSFIKILKDCKSKLSIEQTIVLVTICLAAYKKIGIESSETCFYCLIKAFGFANFSRNDSEHFTKIFTEAYDELSDQNAEDFSIGFAQWLKNYGQGVDFDTVYFLGNFYKKALKENEKEKALIEEILLKSDC